MVVYSLLPPNFQSQSGLGNYIKCNELQNDTNINSMLGVATIYSGHAYVHDYDRVVSSACTERYMTNYEVTDT